MRSPESMLTESNEAGLPEINPELSAGKNEKISSKIAMKFFRHDEKESAVAGERPKPDEEVRLTPKGRLHAKGEADLENIDQAIAFGSPRKRTQETAGLHMAGALDDVTGRESLDELTYKIDQGVEGVDYGTKMMVEPRLNFILDGNGKYVEAANKAFGEGRLMRFLVNESDDLAQENGDMTNSTYTRMAASIASVVEKYITIAPRFDKLVRTSPRGFEDEMQRFFGTHQSIGESFLAKILEKTDGVDKRNAFIEAIGGKGFGFSEGFEIDIVMPEGGGEPKLHVFYEKKIPAKAAKESAANGAVETTEAPADEIFLVDEDVPLSLIHEIAEGK